MLFAKGGRENTGIDATGLAGAGRQTTAPGNWWSTPSTPTACRNGFDLELLDAVAERGAPCPSSPRAARAAWRIFWTLFLDHPGVDAGLAASIFHTRQVDIRELKQYLRQNGVEVRL